MNGVNVNITISFEVNIVKIDTTAYNIKNNAFWLDFAFFVANIANVLKNPTSSKNTDNSVQYAKTINIQKQKDFNKQELTIYNCADYIDETLISDFEEQYNCVIM